MDEKFYCNNINTDLGEIMDFYERELEFGENWIVDYHKHGRLLKQKLEEFKQETIRPVSPPPDWPGQVKDAGVEKWLKMKKDTKKVYFLLNYYNTNE